MPEDDKPFIALIPGGGWMIHRSGAGSDPVVAWVLCKNGDVIPMTADRNSIWPIETPAADDDLEFWHPDSSDRQAQLRLQQHRDEIEAGGV